MELHLFQEGTPHAETIVFLHGFMGRGGDFSALMHPLSNRFHCIAPDLPGHGQSHIQGSPEEDGLSCFDDVGALVLKQLSDLGVTEFVLYGYSMGGRIAQSICLQAPGRVRHLILESASFGIQDELERKERLAKDLKLLDGVLTAADFSVFLEKWHRLPLFCTLQGSDLLGDLIASKLQNDTRQLELALAAMSVGNQRWHPPELSRTGVFIDYFFGEQDRKYKELARSAADALPNMSVRSFANASHNIHLQYLPEVLSALKEILG